MIHTLRELLLTYAHATEIGDRTRIEAEIWNQFGAERTVLIWDMSGFSVLTRSHGIVHYLSMVRRMQEVTRPIVHEYKGALVKFEADNGFAVFPGPEEGIRAAISMNEAFEIENAHLPYEFDIRVSCGLDHGRIILLEGQDFFGEAVNAASKLGEDIASAGEILVARTAMKDLPAGVDFEGEPVRFSVSGLQLDAMRICWRKPD
jgi:adenylate cyclase